MKKKLFATFALGIVFASGLFTACMEYDDGENENLIQGYFTVEGTSSQVTLHQDGGGTIIPNMSSFNNASEFVKNERYLLQLKYKESQVSADRNTITGAELYGGEVLDCRSVLSSTEAASLNVTAADSLFGIISLPSVWAYRGYLTTIFNGYYTLKSAGGDGIYPTANLVYDPEETSKTENQIKFTMCYNRHSPKTDVYTSSSYYQFSTSFRLSSLSAIVPGRDSIQVTIEAPSSTAGADPLTAKIRVARIDLTPGNY